MNGVWQAIRSGLNCSHIAKPRPAFTRHGSNVISLNDAYVDAVELHEMDTKSTQFGDEKNAAPTVEADDHLPTYDNAVEEGESAPITSAKDLVTQILHVDDDPSLNPWTFRMWFLGGCIYYESATGVCILMTQVSGSLCSDPFYRRYTTSNHRLCLSRLYS